MPENNANHRIDRLSVFVPRPAARFEVDGTEYAIPYFFDLPVSEILKYENLAQTERATLEQHVAAAVAELRDVIPDAHADAVRAVLNALALNAAGYGRTALEQTEVAWQQLKILCPSFPDALQDRLPLTFIYQQLARRFGDAPPADPPAGETAEAAPTTAASTASSPITDGSTAPAPRTS